MLRTCNFAGITWSGSPVRETIDFTAGFKTSGTGRQDLHFYSLLFFLMYSIFATTRIVYRTGSMKRYGVRPSVRPFVCPSMGPQQQTRCYRFAAVGLVGRRYRSIAAAAEGKCRRCHTHIIFILVSHDAHTCNTTYAMTGCPSICQLHWYIMSKRPN